MSKVAEALPKLSGEEGRFQVRKDKTVGVVYGCQTVGVEDKKNILKAIKSLK